MKKFIANATALTLSFLPFTVMAQKGIDRLQDEADATATGIGYQNVGTDTNIRDVIIKVINWVLGFLGIAAIVLVIYGGVLWMTSGGDNKRADKGKAVIKNAVIGLAIILAAYILVNFVISSLIKVTGSGAL